LLLSALFSLFLSGLLFFEVGIAPVGIVGQPDFISTITDKTQYGLSRKDSRIE
jgi:hypothetical protein